MPIRFSSLHRLNNIFAFYRPYITILKKYIYMRKIRLCFYKNE